MGTRDDTEINCQLSKVQSVKSILFADENSGRLKNAPLPFDRKFSVFILEGHYITELIIRNCHNNVMYSVVKDTLT